MNLDRKACAVEELLGDLVTKWANEETIRRLEARANEADLL